MFLKLYHGQYAQAKRIGDRREINRIALEVIDTITRKCVPRGRLFEQCWGEQWQQLDIHKATRMAHSALKTPLTESSASLSMSKVDDSSSRFAPSSEMLPNLKYEVPPAKRCCVKAFSSVRLNYLDFIVVSPGPFDVLCKYC